MNLCLGMLTKEGQRTDPTKTQISQGTEKKYHGRQEEWVEKRGKKKNPYFHSMAVTFWGCQLRKPISSRWPCWPQSCQVFGAHISPQGLIFVTFCSWVWGELRQTGFLAKSGQWESCTLKLLLVSSSADFYKVLFSGKGGIREILKQ